MLGAPEKRGHVFYKRAPFITIGSFTDNLGFVKILRLFNTHNLKYLEKILSFMHPTIFIFTSFEYTKHTRSGLDENRKK